MTVYQHWEGSQIQGQQDDGSIVSRYFIDGTNDEFNAWSQLDAATANIVGSLQKRDVNIDGRLGENEWEGSVKWSMIERPSIGDSFFSFDTTGGSEHVTQSLSTVNSYAPSGETAPNYRGAIGVTDSGIEGTDITAPLYNFEERHHLAASAIDAAYKATVFSLTGGVNNAAFKGFAAGEVLFLGASGSIRTNDQWEITYKFMARPNQSGLTIGGNITGVAKDGQDLLWIRYKDEEDGTAKKLIRRPEAVYVERIYPRVDLSLLGI